MPAMPWPPVKPKQRRKEMIVMIFDSDRYLVINPIARDDQNRIIVADIINGGWKMKIQYGGNHIFADTNNGWEKVGEFTNYVECSIEATNYNEAIEKTRKLIKTPYIESN